MCRFNLDTLSLALLPKVEERGKSEKEKVDPYPWRPQQAGLLSFVAFKVYSLDKICLLLMRSKAFHRGLEGPC